MTDTKTLALVAEVERLTRELAEARKPQWIPLSERVPGELSGPVLVCAGRRVGIGGYSNTFGWYFTGADFDDDDTVSHWMPLPQLPVRNSAAMRCTDAGAKTG